MSIVANRISVKNLELMANCVDPDETAHYEPSHLELHCLHKHLFWSTRLKRLNDFFFIILLLTLHC